ncbi:BURP domain protein RD22 [Camellia lanceoleosa]|uniref:BURP domain protein RD22 n=1 Tax=Camellia lanceoleosa TaxID=1840588 RepID=A0ACC0G2D6_9ERIC|nr:BURP domain protein RD22 [Camellia lanceoleosa]
MEFHFLPIVAFLSLTLVASHATLSPEAYWNSVLPNSPMPTAVKDLLHPEWMEDKTCLIGVGEAAWRRS